MIVIRGNVLRNTALVAWIVALIAGFIWLCAYSNSAGPIEEAPEQLDPLPHPELVGQDSKMLLVFFHPRCPCTWATARQLDRIVRKNETPCKVLAYAFYPPDQSEEERVAWIQTKLTDFIANIPNANVVADVGGNEALRNGAFTSGTVLFYDKGQLKFQGGVTSTRGHEGDSIGSDAINSLLMGQKAVHSKSPVFGCPFFP